MKRKFEIVFFDKLNTELEKLWIELERETNIGFFQTCIWQKYWSNQCLNNKTIFFVCIFEDKKLIAILPLNIRKIFYVKVLNWNGFPFSDYNSPIIKNSISLSNNDYRTIFLEIKKNFSFDVIHLINNIDPLFLNNRNFKNNKSYRLKIFDDQSYHLIFNKLRKKIFYEENRLKKKHKLEILLDPNKEQKKQITEFFILQKYHQLERTGGWNYLKYDNYKSYISNLIKLDENSISYSMLKLDNKIIACHIGYIYRNTFFYIFPVYNESFKKFSPGNILFLKLIEYCKEKKFDYLDLTIGDENYKKRLSNINDNIYEIIESFNLVGLIYNIFIKIKFSIKNIFYLLKKYFK